MEYTPISIKENRRMSTWNRLDLQTLGSQLIMPKKLPDRYFEHEPFLTSRQVEGLTGTWLWNGYFLFPTTLIVPISPCYSSNGWGKPTGTLVPWRQGFRHPTRNECMGWFAKIFFNPHWLSRWVCVLLFKQLGRTDPYIGFLEARV